MRLGSWLFVRPPDLKCTYFYPYSRKGKNMVFQPFLGFDTPSGPVCLHGKRALWSLLDSLFPDDPLPRPPLNADFKDPLLTKDVINGLLNDDEAWPHLRLQVRTGDWKDHCGYATKGTFVLSASPASSDYDTTPSLMLFQNTTKSSYTVPITIQTKTKLRTIPAVVIPLDEDNDFKVIITDAINGEHLIFSIIEKSNSCFRPQRMKSFPVSDITGLTADLNSRLFHLSVVWENKFLFPQMSPLDAGMRFYERDDLEFRRFQSLDSFSSLASPQKEKTVGL
jgi:hypothetical protein